jgi:hypothetical protein
MGRKIVNGLNYWDTIHTVSGIVNLIQFSGPINSVYEEF